jgi:hypothetical protein
MLNLKVGDTIEPFFYGDYWIEEGWYCENCQQRMPEDERWQHPQTAFIHCVNGLIVEVTSIKPPEKKNARLASHSPTFAGPAKVPRGSLED